MTTATRQQNAAADAGGFTLFKGGEGGYHTYRIPALAVTPAGTVLALCEGRRHGSNDSGDIDLLVKRSTDGGATWGPQKVIWDDGGNVCGNPCVVVDPATGIVWLLMTWNRGEDHESEINGQTSRDTRRVFVTCSKDDGVTWAAPREITAAVKRPDWTWYATGPGAGICIEHGPHRGRLVIPCDHTEAGSLRYGSHVIYSDDHGGTWVLGGTAPQAGVNECEVAELTGGRLMLNMRNARRANWCRQVAISDDGGATWQERRPDPALIEPICQASLRRHSWPAGGTPGVLLFSNPAHVTSRVNMTLRASYDDGASWPLAEVLQTGPSGYSSLAILPQGDVLCLFEAGSTLYNEEMWLVRLARERVTGGASGTLTSRPAARSDINPRLKALLTHLAATFEVAREKEITTRHWRALDYRDTLDRPPVVAMYPLPADSPWRPFPHREVFDDPEKMLFNELVSAWGTSLVYRNEVGDDLPATIRPNFGTVLVASVFGARIESCGDDPPWVRPFAGNEACEAALSRGPVGAGDGWLPRVVERYRMYRELLDPFPPLQHFVKMTLPDLQGPLDTLEMLRGSELFVELATDPERVARWLSAVAAAQVAVARVLRPWTSDLTTGFTHQHGFMIAGQVLIRNDSALMLSPGMYRDQIAPHDEFVLRELGGGGIHSCGRFMHQVPEMLSLPSVRCLDFGQSHLNEADAVYAQARARKIGLVRVRATTEELTSGSVKRRYPTGVTLLYEAASLEEARAAVQAYRQTP